MLPNMARSYELVESLIFDGLLVIAQARGLGAANGAAARLLHF